MRLLYFLFVCDGLSSCFKEPDFSMTPQIEFADITKQVRLDQFIGATKDSVVISIKFQDGDGDLGLSETEKEVAQATDDFNYLIQPLRKRRGVFQAYTPLLPYSGYFPQLKNDGKPGPIEGNLLYKVEFFHSFTPKNDTLKFEIQIKDRAGNISNKIETRELVVNQI